MSLFERTHERQAGGRRQLVLNMLVSSDESTSR